MEGKKIGGYEAKLTPLGERKRQREMDYQEGYSEGERQKSPENMRAAEYVLSTIDFSVLKEALLEELARCGVPAENANIATIEKILTEPIQDLAAAYDSFVNQLIFSTNSDYFNQLKTLLELQQNIPSHTLFAMQHVFIHEVCHAFSRNRVTSIDSSEDCVVIKSESGYGVRENQHHFSSDPEHADEITTLSASFQAFNEGVTERIAEEVFLEYGKRVGVSEEVREFLRTMVTNHATDVWRYVIYENQIDTMCERIAEYVGVPKEIVWQSIKRGYFEKPALFEEGVITLFQETFGESFLDEQRPLGNKDSKRTYSDFDRKYSIPHPNDYAEKWFEHLGIEKR